MAVGSKKTKKTPSAIRHQQRKSQKPKAAKTVSKPNKTEPKKQISFVTIVKKTWLELSAFWRPLLSITAVYALLYFVLVMSFSVNSNVKELLSSTNGKLTQSLMVILDTTMSSYAGAESDATTLIKMLLFVVATLALLWALRRLQNLQKAKVLDAFYEGSSRVVPVIVVCLLLLLTFLPALFGGAILGFVATSSTSMVETIIVSTISILLIFSSLLLFVMYWPAFYIVTLPELRPLKSLGAAQRLTKGYRFSILRKFILLGICCMLLFVSIVLPVAMLLPFVVPYFLYFVIFGIFLIVQVFLFELYRSLV